MVNQCDPLLSIAIPTYNRSVFLERCLNSIFVQVKEKNYPIEIIISDNCSPDDTSDIVNRFLNEGLSLRYIRNGENKGADFNIAQCYLSAKGKYVLVLGDDDVLYNGAIEWIIRFLSEGDYGVVHLRPNSYAIDYKIPELVKYEKCSLVPFVKEISYYVTFISSNIVNRNNYKQLNVYDYQGTNLIQVPIILSSIINAKDNLYIETPLLGAEQDNTGGYNLFTVFGTNFVNILDDFVNKKIKDIIINRLLTEFFPFFILQRKQKNTLFNFSVSTGVLRKEFASYFKYWLFVFPLEIFPFQIASCYYAIINKIKKAFNKIKVNFNY